MLEVFIEEQRDQFVGDILSHLGLLVLERHIECDCGLAPPSDERAERGDHDGIAHLLDLVALAEPLVSEQVVLVDDAQQVLAGHDPLANDLDALIGKAVVVCRHQLGGNLLRLHQNGAGGLVDRRHAHRDHHGRGKNDYDTDPQ
ncbi:hypothetical protein D3C81_1100160 [compost metagenome]